jgi:dolichol-phosphate mannosyltransferase
MPTRETEDSAWLVLPTYNEAGNIEPLIRQALSNLPPGSKVLVVDDGSPDGTGEIADRLAEELPVEVLHRQGKEGLASAYIAGFRHVLKRGAGLILQMVADFSHDPADLRRLVEAAEGGADVVLGSRYVEGGGVREWSLLRRTISRGGSAYARVALGIGVRDLTGGFKCFRRPV